MLKPYETDANLHFIDEKIEDQEEGVVLLLCSINNHEFSGQDHSILVLKGFYSAGPNHIE